tara:strand:+ start:4473 stop:6497 length:2025 start_codon:yes stop_codon:yes gene_type:complete
MSLYVIDIETDGLISTKIHVMSVGYKDSEGEWKVKSTPDYDTMVEIMSDPDNTVVGHHFKIFDSVQLSNVLGFEVKARIIDTLPLAWYIFPERRSGTFGLGAFGEDYGIPKPEIDDWENLSYEDYKNRCEEDVKINIALWEDILERLVELYGSSKKANSLIKYLMFKMDCLVEQERILTKVDVDKVKENITILEPLLKVKEDALIAAMPNGSVRKTKPVQMYNVKTKTAPKTMYKANGELSKAGERWQEYLKSKGQPLDTKEFEERKISANGQKWYDYLRDNQLPFTTEIVYDDANPSSTKQVKDWLFSLGWEPEIFNEGTNGPVPQIRNKDKNLCDSVLALADVEPAILELDGLTVINHRLGVLNSFLDSVDDDGYCIAGAVGFTNTLRLRHNKPIVNLPGVTGDIRESMEKDGLTKEEAVALHLRDGEIIRECVIAPEGYTLCGSDISSLEDNTKRHYMWDYDPEYVTEQMEEGFDPHLDLAVRAGAVTEEQLTLYKEGDKETKSLLKPLRDIYKQANYSCIYGVGAAKLGKTTGKTTKEAKALIQSYWDRNWSIKQLPNDIETKVIGDQMWLLNPVSNLWYSVRSERDVFSTLNQGTGAFVFDLWVKFMMKYGVIPFLQYHDEMVALVKEGEEDNVKEIVEDAMISVNDLLRLNVTITVDVQFGNTYADVH